MVKLKSDCVHAPDSSDPVIRTATQLAKLYTEIKGVAASDPRLACGAEKATQGILEMQTALVTPRLMPRLEINIPMPAGAAVPAQSPQTQPTQVPPVEPTQPAAAQSS